MPLFFRAGRTRRSGRNKPTDGFRAYLEALEARRLLSTTVSFAYRTFAAIENEPFANNTVANFGADVNGVPIASSAGFSAKVTWGDGSTSGAMIGAPTSGEFPIEGSHTYAEGGNYTITIELDAPDGTTFTGTGSTAHVTDAPLTVTPVLVPADAGQTFTTTVANFVDTNTAAPVTDFTATIQWGDGSNVDAGQILSLGEGQFKVVGTHTYPVAAQSRAYTTLVTVRDIDGASQNTAGTAQIAANPLPPLQPLSGTVELSPTGTPQTLATFDDPSAPSGTGLQATIDWGDGTTSAGQIVLSGGTTYDVDAGRDFTEPGPRTIRVTLQDNQGHTRTIAVDAAVQQSPGVDVAVSVDPHSVVPTRASDLHLNHFYGGETLTVPVVVRNVGTQAATGGGTLHLYVSDDPTGASGDLPLKTTAVRLALQPGTGQTVNVAVTVPGRLIEGQSYYLVARLVPTFKETDAVGGSDANDTAVTAGGFEFIGTPRYPGVFASGLYFQAVRNVLSATTPFTNSSLQQKQAGADPTDDRQFIPAFEGTRRQAYPDGGKIPTIGIGLNLLTVSGPILDTLAADVKDYYAQQAGTAPYNDISGLSSEQVRAMLIAQARLGRRAPTVLSAEEVQDLFVTATLPTYESTAAAAFGTSWPTDPLVRTALVDLNYQGALYSSVVNALTAASGPDYVLAGFKLFDKKNTNIALTDPKRAGGLKPRIDAEYQNLLYSNRSALGSLE